MKEPNSITITVTHGATCGLYPNMPASDKYHKAIVSENALEPTKVTTCAEGDTYHYADLPEGVYHYGVSKEGYTAQCQILNLVGENAAVGIVLTVELCPLAGGGYESGYIMLNTPEFISNCLTSHPDTWGQEYTYLFQTPQFTSRNELAGRHQQTTNEEMWEFITNLSKTCENMHVYTLGNSPKYGFAMPLVLFTKEKVSGLSLELAAQTVRNNGKPTVQYTAQVHSNEPGSTEGALAMMLSMAGRYGDHRLEDIDVYIIPRINLDGAVEVIRTSPTTGDDMNRDYLFMNNQEIRMVTGAYNLFLPELAIDGHEKRSNFLTADEARCTDMELQVGAGSLNHPAVMTETAMKIALQAIEKGTDLGLRAHFYSCLASAAGGSAGSSYYGTRNSLSFLVETPGGTTLGNHCMARRVMGQYVLASTVMDYAAKNASEIVSMVRSSRWVISRLGEDYSDKVPFVLEHGSAPTGSLPIPMIRVLTGEIADPARDMAYNEQPIAVRSRPRATAYVIPKGLPNEQQILRVITNHGIPYDMLPAGTTLPLRRYCKTDGEVDLLEETPVCFENGCYVLCNTVPSTILSVILEPDFNASSGRKMSLLSMGLVSPDGSGNLPIYRFCHNLHNGKLPSCAIS